LVCFTNAAAKGIFGIIWHFWRQDVPHVKMSSASSCLVSTRSRQDVFLRCKKVLKRLAHSGNTRNC